MKDDLDRWIDLEGPPPEGVRELLDAACDVPDMTPEQEARMDRKVYAAVAEERRRWARRRALERALGGVLVAACLAGAGVLAFRPAGTWDLAGALRSLKSAATPVPIPRIEPEPVTMGRDPPSPPAQPERPAPPVAPAADPLPATSGPPDGGRLDTGPPDGGPRDTRRRRVGHSTP